MISQLITTKQTARLLNMSPHTVRRLAATEEWKDIAVKVGGGWRFKLNTLVKKFDLNENS